MESIREWDFWDFRGAEYTDKKFLVKTPYPMIGILILYLWFVLKFGPEFMKKRPPFKLDKILLWYNAIQVLISVSIFVRGSIFVIQNGLWNKTCLSERNDTRSLIADGSHYYFLVKLIELLDTVFFVLRKKQRQVSFLHVYHHALMVVATWSIVKYNRSDGRIFLGILNSLVHVVMYAYYGLSVFPTLSKYLWWKKYITMMQLVQFIFMFIHVVVSHLVSECPPAYILLSSVCTNTIFFLYLFGDFYVKSYIKKYNAKNIVKAGKVISQNMNTKNIGEYHKLAMKIH